MSFLEYLGFSVVIFLCAVGAYVVGRCLWIGARQMWRDIGRERRNPAFETKD